MGHPQNHQQRRHCLLLRHFIVRLHVFLGLAHQYPSSPDSDAMLWVGLKSDGTTIPFPDSSPAKPLCTGSISPSAMVLDTFLIAPTITADKGYVITRLDGFTSTFVKDFTPGPDRAIRFVPYRYGNLLLFYGWSTEVGMQVFATDGLTAWPVTVHLAFSCHPFHDSRADSLVCFCQNAGCPGTYNPYLNNNFVFTATGEFIFGLPNITVQLYATKGSPETTRLISSGNSVGVQTSPAWTITPCHDYIIYPCSSGICSTDLTTTTPITSDLQSFTTFICHNSTHYVALKASIGATTQVRHRFPLLPACPLAFIRPGANTTGSVSRLTSSGTVSMDTMRSAYLRLEEL